MFFLVFFGFLFFFFSFFQSLVLDNYCWISLQRLSLTGLAYDAGPSCSKLVTLLANETLNFKCIAELILGCGIAGFTHNLLLWPQISNCLRRKLR